jgi:phage terminase small subunit
LGVVVYVKLTPKQEKFVQGVVSGLSQREAYKKAGYSVDGKTNEYIDIKASELMKNGKVLVRYNELLNEHKKKALWTREKAVEELLWIKDKSKGDIEEVGLRQANSNAFLNAIKELNELESVYLFADEKFLLEKAKKEAEIEFTKERTTQLKDTDKDGSPIEIIIKRKGEDSGEGS